MDYQRVIVLGNTTQEAQLKQSDKGEFVLLIVASKNRKGKRIFFPVFVVGKQIDYAKRIPKGALVLVDGAIDITEYKVADDEKRVEFRIFSDVIKVQSIDDESVQVVKEVLGAEEVSE